MNNIIPNEKSGMVYDLLDLPFVYKSVQFLLRKLNTNSRMFDEFFIFDENALVLDCGCGPCHYRKYIKSKKYIGLDMNKKHIEIAKQKYPNDKFIVQDLSKFIDTKIENFDVVLMIGILHHLPDRVCSQIFENIYSSLSHNGVIYSIDPVYINNQRVVAKYLASRDKGNHVRNPDSYKNLVGSKFKIESSVISNLLRVPYDHFFMKIKKDV